MSAHISIPNPLRRLILPRCIDHLTPDRTLRPVPPGLHACGILLHHQHLSLVQYAQRERLRRSRLLSAGSEGIRFFASTQVRTRLATYIHTYIHLSPRPALRLLPLSLILSLPCARGSRRRAAPVYVCTIQLCPPTPTCACSFTLGSGGVSAGGWRNRAWRFGWRRELLEPRAGRAPPIPRRWRECIADRRRGARHVHGR